MSGMPRPWLERSTLLCADDFAYNAACSDAIECLATARKIDATSAMVLSPRWAHDAPKLQAVRGHLSVGLHLDWTSKYAVQAGHGMGLAVAMVRAGLGGFGVDQARKVIAKQMDLFEAQWGGAPDHIDGHQHVQQFAGIREALVQEIAQRYQATKPWLRIANPVSESINAKAAVVKAMGALRLETLARQAGIPCRQYLSGIYNFKGGAKQYAKLLADWQRSAPAGSVIMCHPGLAAEADDSIGPSRVWEYQVLSAQGRRI